MQLNNCPKSETSFKTMRAEYVNTVTLAAADHIRSMENKQAQIE